MIASGGDDHAGDTVDNGTVDLAAAVERHVDRFNEAVRTRDFTAFVATFADHATMRFTNVPAGPFAGRSAISAAYAAQPPNDTMTVRSVEEVDQQTARVRFAWAAGGSGTMTLRWLDGLVADLEIAFD
jgi:hypothetical protein